MTDRPAAPSLVIPVYPEVDLLDVAGVYEMLSWAGISIDLVAAEPGLVAARAGFSFAVAKSFDDAPGPYSALWVPGGAPQSLADIIADPDGPYLGYVRAQAASADWICSVCEGALLLAAAGLLDGHEATTHWAFIPCLMQAYPAVRVADGHPRFVLSGNRLTGGGISSGLDEALKLIELLVDRATAEAAQQATQYYPDPPVSSRIPNTVTCPVPDMA
ncbi:MAG: DJ-1/PfpI family protein [Alphaproteobacteria bacterium]|nr:DJ-1/PfpI family protein [Alphaproteobacteria bacterium]MBV9370645.1 DJ-1/PfpI family protein [Alphaproteobacteria bacterium]MBV9899991.1 DJ-1/PfpI family protein [Alphaproteobacteria bacterium]